MHLAHYTGHMAKRAQKGSFWEGQFWTPFLTPSDRSEPGWPNGHMTLCSRWGFGPFIGHMAIMAQKGQNGSFWGSQNDPSDEWFWPFSPPKPGQEGSKRGSKMGHFGPLQTPSRPPQGPFKGAEILLLAISSVILAPRGPGGVIQGSKMTHFGGPFWTPF